MAIVFNTNPKETIMPFLTAIQVAYWLDVTEEEVMKRAMVGELPAQSNCQNRLLFSGDIIPPDLLNDNDAKFSGGITLRTADGLAFFEVIRPTYQLDNFGNRCAIFEARDGSWHVRPWKTSYVFKPHSLRHLPDVILDCEDDATPQIRYEYLPEFHSAFYQFFKTATAAQQGREVAGNFPNAQCH
jgi:hypothetical protein